MSKEISNVPVKWKPKMKLMCHGCHTITKLIISKVHNSKDDMSFRIKCKACGDEYCVTEDLLREMKEEMEEAE